MEKRRKDERAEIRPGRFRRFQSRLNACPIILLRHKKNANKKLPKKNMNLAPKKCFLFFAKKNCIIISFWSRRLLMGHIPPPIDSIVLRRRRRQCKCCHSPSGLGDAAHEWRTRVLIFRRAQILPSPLTIRDRREGDIKRREINLELLSLQPWPHSKSYLLVFPHLYTRSLLL